MSWSELKRSPLEAALCLIPVQVPRQPGFRFARTQRLASGIRAAAERVGRTDAVQRLAASLVFVPWRRVGLRLALLSKQSTEAVQRGFFDDVLARGLASPGAGEKVERRLRRRVAPPDAKTRCWGENGAFRPVGVEAPPFLRIEVVAVR